MFSIFFGEQSWESVCKRLAIMMVPSYSYNTVVVMSKLFIRIHLVIQERTWQFLSPSSACN